MKMRRRTNWRAAAWLVVAGAVTWVWIWLNPRHPERVDIRSRALGEKRFLLVHLPPGYGSKKNSYPLLVLLDGGDQKQFAGDKTLFSRSREVLARLEAEGLPRLVLVGIGNRDRVRDMTPVRRPDIYAGGGGSMAFMEFIEAEVVPFVRKRWRIGNRRILYGESYGGLFVLDALARGRQAFSDYIAVSPTVGVWPEGLDAAFQRNFGAMSQVRSLTIVQGENDTSLVTNHAIPFFSKTDALLPSGLRRRLDVLPGEGHNPRNSLELGLRFIFSGENAAAAGNGPRTGRQGTVASPWQGSKRRRQQGEQK
jgi:hypothetical protein